MKESWSVRFPNVFLNIEYIIMFVLTAGAAVNSWKFAFGKLVISTVNSWVPDWCNRIVYSKPFTIVVAILFTVFALMIVLAFIMVNDGSGFVGMVYDDDDDQDFESFDPCDEDILI